MDLAVARGLLDSALFALCVGTSFFSWIEGASSNKATGSLSWVRVESWKGVYCGNSAGSSAISFDRDILAGLRYCRISSLLSKSSNLGGFVLSLLTWRASLLSGRFRLSVLTT